MNTRTFAAALAAVCLMSTAVDAASFSAKHEQRLASRRVVEQHPFSSFGQDYIDAKNFITDKLGLQVGLDISYTAQRLSPSGKQTSIQGMYYPYITWTLFQDKAWGSGAVNFNYNFVHYWGQEAAVLQGRGGVVSAFNDGASDDEDFS